MSAPRVLLLARTPPGSDSVGRVFLRDLCLLYPRDRIECFVVESADTFQPAPELDWLPISYTGKPNSRLAQVYTKVPLRCVRGAIDALDHLYQRYWKKWSIVRDAVKFGQEHGAELVWAVLDSPMVIYVAPHVASRLGVPLHTLVWDPPEHFRWLYHVNAWSVQLMLRDFARALRSAIRCAVISEEMRNAYSSQFGVDTVVLRHGLEETIRQPPASGFVTKEQLVIGFAGSLYASDEWKALLNALHGVEWRVADRVVRIRLLGYSPPTPNIPVNIEFLGWRSIPEVVKLLSQADILYLPYWFDPAHQITVRLAFPTKLTTYLAAGRPVFYHGPRESTAARFLREYPAGPACHSLDADDIVATLTRFVDNREVYAQMTAAGKAAADREFSLEVFRQRFAQFLGVDKNDLLPGPS
jgi:glycosyltransferase involved in cell wall biosynthesis